METTRYLIVGGGMTADAACKGIREHDADGRIVLVGAEPHAPYKRPPLSKKLWFGDDESTVWRGTEKLGVDLRLGRRIVRIDPAGHTAVDDEGTEYRWEKLLLATGGQPRRLGGDDTDVVYFRTLDDYRQLHAAAGKGARAIVVGGGFIGSEIAAALNTAGSNVTMLFPEPSISWRVLPLDLSEYVSDVYREHGVEVLAAETVAAVTPGGVRTGSGAELEAEMVVAGLGIVPATELAEAAGLPVENGIVVDDRGRVVGYEDVFAAGDVAQFPIVALGRSGRVEHEDHANSHGRAVGANMAGADEPYDHLPFFYSDMFDLGYEAVGELDSRLPVVAAWQEPHRKGVVAFVDEESRPRGFLLWDVWGKVDAATELIRAGQPVDEDAVAALA
jgi:NADPH-dependent 2,4-dienoyl-CoA reductase/sulfur reductase-like enzyme